MFTEEKDAMKSIFKILKGKGRRVSKLDSLIDVWLVCYGCKRIYLYLDGQGHYMV